MKRRVVAGAIILAVAFGAAGCDEGPTQNENEAAAVQMVGRLCERHGGVGYMNLDDFGHIDELRCRDGALAER